MVEQNVVKHAPFDWHVFLWPLCYRALPGSHRTQTHGTLGCTSLLATHVIASAEVRHERIHLQCQKTRFAGATSNKTLCSIPRLWTCIAQFLKRCSVKQVLQIAQ